jgi:ribosomal protein S18 acetylase RimI-like enzyme
LVVGNRRKRQLNTCAHKNMFCSATLAARIDRAEARQMIAIARGAADRDPTLQPFVVPVGQGAAVFAGPSSPTNKMIGVGFGEPLDAAVLDDVEARFATRGARLQAEISVLAEPEAHATLVARGYQPAGFEHVLGYPMGDAIAKPPAGIAVELVSAADLAPLCEVLVEAFASPDVGGVGGDAIPPADEIRRWFLITMSVDGFRGYVARIGGAIAGGGALRIDGDIAQFSGAGTLPAFRRRGVQTALLRARLADAAAAGCAVGVVVTQPGSKSQQNVEREGFGLLYARQLLVKAPA